MERLLELLTRERVLLQDLLHRLRILSLMLAGGESRFLTQASDEVYETSAELAETETLRAIALAEVAARMGLRDDDVTLRAVAAVAEPAQRAALLDHRTAMVEQVQELTAMTERGTELASMGLGDIRATLERLATGSRDLLYGRDGGSAHVEVPPTQFDARA